ncbi:hypothetical protein VKT23_003050 [Stygiomarasmius scandens]|uniref:Uncharacterized protein n=1 Tax=Marasmiellus scandens TaxID=2682957 RepID=A0ABR1JZ45_9AGAR
MQSNTSNTLVNHSCTACTNHHAIKGWGSLNEDNCTMAWILKDCPDVTSYQPTSKSQELIVYKPSPFNDLIPGPTSGTVSQLASEYPTASNISLNYQAPLDSVTGALLGYNRSNLVDTLHLAFPNPYICALITHAFRESILLHSLTDDQLIVVNNDKGPARVFFSPQITDQIWADLHRMGQMVLSSTVIDNPSSPIPLSYSCDFNNFEWIHSNFSHLLLHITFTRSDNLLRYIYGNTCQTMHKVYTIIQFVAQRYTLWIIDQVRHSISRGYLSISNWGSYFGLTHDETLT